MARKRPTKRAPAPSPGVSLREYSRHRKAMRLAGGTLKAVQQAIAGGRLSKSLTPDRKRIADVAAADEEWRATTLVDRIPLTGPTAPCTPPPDLQESRARREAAEAELAEIELAERKRELVPARDVEAKLVSVFSHCKNKLLGIPSRARQQDPGLTGPQIGMIESLIREALEDLAAPDR